MRALRTGVRTELRIRMFRPSEDPASAQAYLEGQARALADFGVKGTTSMELAWDDPFVRLVLVESMDGEPRGGICIHQQSELNSLPVARALSRLEPRLQDRLLWFRRRGVAELCAGWASRQYRGAGIYAASIHAAMAAMPSLSIPFGVGFSDVKTLGLYESLGFEPDRSLGDDGTFPYPDARYRSMVLWGDCTSLAGAAEAHRTSILAIRAALQRGGNAPFRMGKILYDLTARPAVTRVRTA